MTELEIYIKTYFGVSNDDIVKITSFFKPKKLNKGGYFLKTGRNSDRLGFVQTGIVREFVNIGDKEVTNYASAVLIDIYPPYLFTLK